MLSYIFRSFHFIWIKKNWKTVPQKQEVSEIIALEETQNNCWGHCKWIKHTMAIESEIFSYSTQPYWVNKQLLSGGMPPPPTGNFWNWIVDLDAGFQ